MYNKMLVEIKKTLIVFIAQVIAMTIKKLYYVQTYNKGNYAGPKTLGQCTT